MTCHVSVRVTIRRLSKGEIFPSLKSEEKTLNKIVSIGAPRASTGGVEKGVGIESTVGLRLSVNKIDTEGE